MNTTKLVLPTALLLALLLAISPNASAAGDDDTSCQEVALVDTICAYAAGWTTSSTVDSYASGWSEGGVLFLDLYRTSTNVGPGSDFDCTYCISYDYTARGSTGSETTTATTCLASTAVCTLPAIANFLW